MSSVFLIGAGASYGSGPCTPYNPPLGTQFFEEFKKLGGVATTVDEQLSEMFNLDFEKAMDEFFEKRNLDVTSFLREMAKYFCQFEPLEGNLYGELIKILGKGRKKVTFVTTNYDLLIELAAAQQGMYISYGGLPAPHNNLPLLKIHGSCHFLPDLGNSTFKNCHFGTAGTRDSTIVEAPVKIATSIAEVLKFCNEQDSLAPALAMYSPDKRVLYCKRFVEQQQEAWRNAVDKASSLYIIGLKVHAIDDHIWGILAKSKCTKYYIGGEPEEFLEWAKNAGAKNCYAIASRFNEALPTIARHFNTKWKQKN